MTLTISVWSDKLKSVGLLFKYIDEAGNTYKDILDETTWDYPINNQDNCVKFKNILESIPFTFNISGSKCNIIFSRKNVKIYSYRLSLITKENSVYYTNYIDNNEIGSISDLDIDQINEMKHDISCEISKLKQENKELNDIIISILQRLKKLEN